MKLVTLITLGMFGLAVQGHSAGFPSALNQAMNESVQKAAQSTTLKASQSCSNFSGDWQGTCTSQSRSMNLSFTIDQNGCESVSINKESLSLRQGVAISAATDLGLFAAADISTRFANGGQNAVLQVGFAVNKPELAAPVGGRVSILAERQGDTLNLHGLYHTWIALQDITKEEFECTLHQ